MNNLPQHKQKLERWLLRLKALGVQTLSVEFSNCNLLEKPCLLAHICNPSTLPRESETDTGEQAEVWAGQPEIYHIVAETIEAFASAREKESTDFHCPLLAHPRPYSYIQISLNSLKNTKFRAEVTAQVKSPYLSCRGPKYSSQHSCQVTLNYMKL